jgi:hypothetical protein
MNIGNLGDSTNFVSLFCDLQTYGKIVIRKGWRVGLPTDRPPLWVFCPLIKAKFPRDRELVENCQRCAHCKGLSHDLETIKGMIAPQNPKSKLPPRVSFTREELEKACEDCRAEDENWRKEEEKV